MVLFIIILLATVLRLLFLDKVPTTITGDELSYILSGKVFLLTGFDPSGSVAFWQPLLFKYPLFNSPQAEINYYLLMPFMTGPFSLFMIRLPFALLGVVLVVAVYFVAKELFSKKVALVASFFIAISPWLIVTNRTAYEMTSAMTFYTLGLFVLLKAKGWKIFMAFPIFLLAFYSYIATKLVFVPFILLTLVYLYFFKNKKKYGQQYLVFGLVSVVFVGLFGVLLSINNGQRLADIFLPNSPLVAKQVDMIRAASIHTSVTSLFINKLTIYVETLVNHLLMTLSVSYLFVTGDNFFGLWRHGLFYVLDALFLLMGIYFLVRKEKPLAYFFVAAILIGLIPQIFHKVGDPFTPHITFIFPFVLMVVAYGVVETSAMVKRKKSCLIGFLAMYGILAANFVFMYFTNFPIQAESDLQVRVLSRYIVFAKKQNERVVIYSSRSNDLLRKHIFYASLYVPETVAVLRRELTAREPQVDNVSFRSCNEKVNPAKTKEILVTMTSCKQGYPTLSHVTIGQLVDGGAVFNIYNDKVCSGISLKRYPSDITFRDLGVEKLSKEDFCKTFVTSLF